MQYTILKSHAKINLALNIIGKNSSLHRIESIITFIDLHDVIKIKKSKSNKNNISFKGKFSKNINKRNSVSKLLEILEKKKILKETKFSIVIHKRIPNKAGLGGGSMNAANILRYLIKKKIIKLTKKEIFKISNLVGSDVILGLNSTNTILTSKNKLNYFQNCRSIYALIVKPYFGCSTKEIYSKVSKFNKPKFSKPNKKMFNFNYLKKSNNSLEAIAFSMYPKLRKISLNLDNLCKPIFVRMTGSGSALVAYFRSKAKCDSAKKKFKRMYKNYWCITSKTI